MPKPFNTAASTETAGEIKTTPMNQKPKQSLVRNTLILIIVPVIILWGFYLLFVYQGVYKTTFEKHIDKTSLLNFKCATRINNQLSAISNQVYTITHNIELRDTISLKNIESKLTNILVSNKHIYGTSISLKNVWIDKENKHDFFLYKYKPGNSIKRIIINEQNYHTYPYKEKEWWKYSATYFETKWSNPYYDKGLGNILMITYSAPLFINNRFAGVIGIDVDVSTLNSIIDDASKNSEDIYNKTQVIVFSSDSTIVIDKKLKNVGKKLSDFYGKNKYQSFTKALDTIFNNRFGYSDFLYDNIHYKMFYGPIPQANWIVVSILESSKINKAVRESILPKIIMTMIFILILVVLIYILSKKITDPITELCDVTLKIAGGDYDKDIKINRKDEIGTLAQNFQLMKENLKKREQSLKEASKNITQLLDNLPLVVMQFNIERKVIYYNKTAKDKLFSGFRDKNTLMNFSNWLSFIKDKNDREKATGAFLGKHCVIEGFNIITDNEYATTYFTNKYIQAHFIPYLKDNSVDSVTLIILDLTEIKQNENLRVEKKSAEIANKAKSEFLARMSHEIRTPLNAVIGFANLALQKQTGNEQVHNYLTKITTAANHLLNIINDILDYSKIEAGKMELEKTAFDIEEILNDVFDLGASLAYKKNLELIISHSPLIPHPLHGDPVKLKQIIVNLVSNAVKFTQEGEIVVNIDIKKQTKNKTTLLVSVKDTGIGLSAEQQKILFQSFVQADGSITRRFGGTGIGLTISKRLVELMNGKIWIESEEGKGSTFWFIADFETDGQKDSFSQYIKKFNFPTDIRNLNILVCDDNQTTLKIIKTMLEAFSFKATTTDKGAKVIRLLEKGNKYNLLIIDMVMPQMNGLQTMQTILNKGLKSGIGKVILLSAHDAPVEESELNQYGIDLYQRKPVTYSVLFDGIMNVFGKEHLKKDNFPNNKRENNRIDIVSKNCRVLVADDNEVNREVIGDLLEAMGLQVDFAVNGQEVVEMAKPSKTQPKYCMVFMDIQMPVMDGYEATRTIRKQSSFNDLPIVALSADVMQGVKERCTEAGMNDFVAKPINPSELAQVITKWAKHVDIAKKQPQSTKITGLSHLNSQEGVERIGGDVNRYIELLKKFSTNHRNFVNNFNALARREEQLKLVHTFKGVTGNIGAVKLHKLAIKLESNIKDNKDYSKVLSDIDRELKSVVTEIKQTEVVQKTGQTTEHLTSEQLNAALDKITALLDEDNPDALDKLNKLAPYYKGNAAFTKSINLAKSYRFDEASAMLKTLIK